MSAYDARYYGEHCGIEVTTTLGQIHRPGPPDPTLPWTCMSCRRSINLVLIEVGSELSDLDDNLFDDEEDERLAVPADYGVAP